MIGSVSNSWTIVLQGKASQTTYLGLPLRGNTRSLAFCGASDLKVPQETSLYAKIISVFWGKVHINEGHPGKAINIVFISLSNPPWESPNQLNASEGISFGQKEIKKGPA